MGRQWKQSLPCASKNVWEKAFERLHWEGLKACDREHLSLIYLALKAAHQGQLLLIWEKPWGCSSLFSDCNCKVICANNCFYNVYALTQFQEERQPCEAFVFLHAMCRWRSLIAHHRLYCYWHSLETHFANFPNISAALSAGRLCVWVNDCLQGLKQRQTRGCGWNPHCEFPSVCHSVLTPPVYDPVWPKGIRAMPIHLSTSVPTTFESKPFPVAHPVVAVAWV